MAKAKTKQIPMYVYRCIRTCEYQGRRFWEVTDQELAEGTEHLYEFDHELPAHRRAHFEEVRQYKRTVDSNEPEGIPIYNVIGREPTRQSERQ